MKRFGRSKNWPLAVKLRVGLNRRWQVFWLLILVLSSAAAATRLAEEPQIHRLLVRVHGKLERRLASIRSNLQFIIRPIDPVRRFESFAHPL